MYDLIIIGAGPAGLSAGLYAGRARLKTLILEKLVCGGQILLTEKIENYPGFSDGVLASNLMAAMEKQVRNLEVEILQQKVEQIEQVDKLWRIKTDSRQYNTKTVILACGSEPKRLDVEGEALLIGKGVSYCATCDAPLYRKKVVCVVGGGNNAVEEALFLSRFAEKIFLIHRRDQLRATKILAERLMQNKKIIPCWDSVVRKIEGREKVSGVILKNLKDGSEKNISCDGIFIYVGRQPSTGFLGGLVECDEQGHIITDEAMCTNQAGIFAAGDCRKKLLRQVITACAEGAIAAYSAQQYLESNYEEHHT